MAKRRIFTVETPLGYRAFLTRDRWRQIVRNKHPALAGHERDVRACLELPALVCERAKDENVHLYYVPLEERHLCVVVTPADQNERFVVTACFTTNIKKGKELWTS